MNLDFGIWLLPFSCFRCSLRNFTLIFRSPLETGKCSEPSFIVLLSYTSFLSRYLMRKCETTISSSRMSFRLWRWWWLGFLFGWGL